MKKYLLVISYCEEETYLYNSLEEMLKAHDVNSIEELLESCGSWATYTIYEVSKIYEK